MVGVLILLVVAGLVAGGIALGNRLTGGSAEADGTTAAPGQTAQAGGGKDKETASNTAPASSTPQTGCDESKVVVESSSSESVYRAGMNPELILSVTNNGDKPCQINVGTSQMEFIVTSGDDRVFSSRDCQAEASDLMKTIEPGQTEKANFTWERHRTSPGCKPMETSPKPGYYVLMTKLGERVSDKTSFELE
ncbi:hypothetical protein GCM10009611_01580 [Arthrobacter roseus]